jgi:hypothetical protein
VRDRLRSVTFHSNCGIACSECDEYECQKDNPILDRLNVPTTWREKPNQQRCGKACRYPGFKKTPAGGKDLNCEKQ